jgi:uncharacterized lipoprotein YehR (DUF1307 family)
MKKILSFLLVSILALSLFGCGNKQQAANSQPAENKEHKIYKQGEEAFITDSSGKQMYSLKINGVKTANDFEYKKDFPETTKQIVEVDYTYKNIAKNDEGKLFIHGTDLQLMDGTGAVAQSSSMFPKEKPQKIDIGVNCSVQGYYGLKNKSDKVKIIFNSATYKKTITFEVPVN